MMLVSSKNSTVSAEGDYEESLRQQGWQKEGHQEHNIRSNREKVSNPGGQAHGRICCHVKGEWTDVTNVISTQQLIKGYGGTCRTPTEQDDYDDDDINDEKGDGGGR